MRNRDRIVARAALALVFAATGPAADLRAAPPAGAAEPPSCEATPSPDEARLQVGRELSQQAEERYQALLVRGEVQNDAAVATGVVGGALAAVGTALLVVAAVRHRRGKPRGVAVRGVSGGLQVRF